MAELEYSVEAKNVLNSFYGTEKVVFVEGQDDIPFWEFLFKKFTNLKVYVDEVGGKLNLQNYINEIIEESADFFVAKDSDYDCIISDNIQHPYILKTLGYSIENTMISKDVLFHVVKNLCLLPESKINKDEFQDWLVFLDSATSKLILLSIFNEINQSGISIIPKSSDRFMVSKKNAFICDHKINEYLEQCNFELSVKDREKIIEKIHKLNLKYLDLLNGHFFLSAAHRFVTLKSAKLKDSTAKEKIQCSFEAFYALLISAFMVSFDESHPHYAHYQAQFSLVA